MFVYTMKEFNAVVISLEAFKEMEIDFENAVFYVLALCNIYVHYIFRHKCMLNVEDILWSLSLIMSNVYANYMQLPRLHF